MSQNLQLNCMDLVGKLEDNVLQDRLLRLEIELETRKCEYRVNQFVLMTLTLKFVRERSHIYTKFNININFPCLWNLP